MIRKLTAMVATMLVIGALFPALASAAVNASATLTAGGDVYPGASQEFRVRVTSNENPITGAMNTANAIRVTLPPSLRDYECGTPPTGWTCTPFPQPGIPGFLFRGVLNPGASPEFPFTADVTAPNNADRQHSIRVEYSEDLGGSFTRIADLTTLTRILQIVPFSLTEVDTANVVNRATAGQSLDTEFRVRSYAAQTVTVTPTLSSNNANDAISAVTPTLSISSNGTATARFSVATQQAATRSRNMLLTADATATGADAPNVDNTVAIVVEGVPALALDAGTISNPVVTAGANGLGQTYNLSIQADKLNIPAVSNLSGSVTLTGPQTLTASLESVNDGANALPRPEANDLVLKFGPVTVTNTTASGSFDATFQFSGTDDNGYPYFQEITLEDLIALDNLRPTVILDELGITGQDQVKSADTLPISGSVPDGDVQIPQNLTLTLAAVDRNTNTTVEYTVPTANISVNGRNFSTSVPLSFFSPDQVATGTLTVFAQAVDRAGLSGGDSKVINIDNVAPLLVQPARIVPGAEYGEDQPVVEVAFTNEYATLVRGGCVPTHWDVSNTNVISVKYSDGTACQNGQPSPAGDNIRILVVTDRLVPEVSVNVDYLPDTRLAPLALVTDRAVDGALNRALEDTVTTISGIAPPLPQLINVDRFDTDGGGREDATFAMDAYWVNRGGNAGEAPIASIGGGRGSYEIQVLNSAGDVIATAPASGEDDAIRIPLPATIGDCEGNGTNDGVLVDGRCQTTRSIRFFNASAAPSVRYGPLLDLTVILDRAAPEIATANQTAEGVTVTLDEVLFAGANRGLDWAARELNEDRAPGDAEYFYYGAENVSGSGATRDLGVSLPGNGAFAGAEYRFFDDGSGALKYEDYAGNRMGFSEGFPG